MKPPKPTKPVKRIRGRFIVLEGGEGAGKSTQARNVALWLGEKGRDPVLTREPGGSRLAEAIRELVLRPWREGVDGTTELLLMFAARAAHLRATIRPALAAGRDVVCDRFIDATYAYQGAGRGLPTKQIDTLATMVIGDLTADLIILLDVPPAIGSERVQNRGSGNRFDHEQLRFAEAVREAYLRRARKDPGRYAIIDAGGKRTDVTRAIETVLEARL